MFLALYSITPFPAPCAAYGSGCPGKRIWNAKCYACTSYSGCLSPVGRSPSGNQPCGYRRRTIPAGHSPTPVPVRSFQTCYSNPVFFQRVYWKNSSSIMGHYLLSFVHGPLPAAAVRNIQPSASPPFFKKMWANLAHLSHSIPVCNFVASCDKVDL